MSLSATSKRVIFLEERENDMQASSPLALRKQPNLILYQAV